MGQYVIDNFGEEFLNKVWSDKNDKSAFEYSPQTHKEVWWKCPDGKHEDYPRLIYSSNGYDFRCPSCIQEREESILQEKVRLYLESFEYTISHENKCTLIPKNPKIKKTNSDMPFDNEIRELRLLIEVHGRQHYEISGFHYQSANKNNTTPKQELHYQKLKDRYKKIYAYIKGYHYIEVPYWTDNEKEEWKQLIDNKIQEILKLSE